MMGSMLVSHLGKRSRGAARLMMIVCAVAAAPLLAWAATTFTTLDSTGNTGAYASLALGSDGFAVISYQENDDGDLRVAKCFNSGCTLANVVTVESAGHVGWESSIAVDANGIPVISHYDASNGDLRVTKCGNSGCTLSYGTAVDATGTTGYETSIAIGDDGFPVVAYADLTNGDLRVGKCSNSGCTTSTTLTTVDSTGTVGREPSIAIGDDGFPVISYYDTTNSSLKVAKCSDAGCTASTTLTTVDAPGNVGSQSSITIGDDGFPVISYYDGTNTNLKVAKCGDAGCTATTITTLDSAGSVGQYNSIAIGDDGFPVISYWDLTNSDLKVAKCSNAGCTASKLRTVDSSGNVATYSSLKIASNGFPMISYRDESNSALKFAYCDRASCMQISAPSAPTGFSANVSGADLSLSWTNPTSSIFDHVVIRRSTTGSPSAITDGTAVTNTSGSSYTDASLTLGTHYYGIFAVDEDDNVSTAATASGTVTVSVGGGSPSISLQQLRKQNGLDRYGYPLSSSSSVPSSPGTSAVTDPVTPLHPAPTSPSSAPSVTSSSSSSAPVAEQRKPDVPPLEQRTCTRVMKWFRGNSKMLSRVNVRLQKWLGFRCEG